MIAGCPNWADFADRALLFFVERGKFTHGQLDQIKHLHPRVKLTLAKGLQKEHRLAIDFRSVLYPDGRKDSPKGRRLYAALSQLGKTFVTTNYDDWLDSEIVPPMPMVADESAPNAPAVDVPRKVIHNVHDLTPDHLSNAGTVIHLHGAVSDPDKMILTTQDYVSHYANDRLARGTGGENYVLSFLDFLFSHRTVLFVGYGLEELEILEYVIGKARLQQAGTLQKEERHYLLQGFYSHEHELMRSLTRYYRECGIRLIPFLRDEKNWDQLIDALEHFARLMPAAGTLKSEMLLEMEDLLDG